MKRKGIVFKGCRLMPGSKAHQLHEDGKIKDLEKHMAQLNKEAKARGEEIG